MTDKALIPLPVSVGKPSRILDSITDEERKKMEEIRLDQMNFKDSPYYTRDASLVLDDFLFLGAWGNASDRRFLDKYQIKHILNVCDLPTNEQILQDFHVINIPMPDDPETDIKQHFDRTNELLRSFFEKNERCLVHCAAGISRSATIVLAYLMKYHHETLREAYAFLQEKRPQIGPNEGFLLQLIRYEKELIRSREIPKEEEKNGAKAKHEENPIETMDEFKDKHHTEEKKS